MHVTHENVMLIYEWFRRSMRRVGRKVAFPKDTDQRKTYQYRALKKFLQNVHEWDLDERTTRTVIDAVVKYGREKRLLDKGAMLLNMSGIIDIAIESVTCTKDAMTSVINEIARCKAMLDERGINSITKLVEPVTTGGYSCLYYLVRAGKIPVHYLAVSRIAYAALNQVDRMDCPSNRALLKIRAKLLLDTNTRHELEEILGEDLNTMGLGVTSAAAV